MYKTIKISISTHKSWGHIQDSEFSGSVIRQQLQCETTVVQ